MGALPCVEMIPIDRVTVVNPRVRNRKIFKTITENIGQIGLKRPITVSRHMEPDGPRFDLVCGQGRLDAYRNLGQHEIPALVIEATADDCMVMSLVENLARRQHRAIDLLQDIEGLKRRGYSENDIAGKTGLTVGYVRGVIRLLEKGEHRLLRAVESGHIPLSVAVDIAESDDAGVQQALQHAYENNILRGRKLMLAKRLVEQRQQRGRGLKVHKSQRPVSAAALLRAYQQDTEKKRLMIRKAELAKNRLLFMVEALRKLLRDENFVTLLRAEGLDTFPQNLAERVRA